MAARSTLKVTVDLTRDLERATRELLKKELLVGIPGDAPPRAPEPGEKTAPSNAVIGFVQEFGDNEKNIPARPFLLPGVEAAKKSVVQGLQQAGRDALDGKAGGLDKGMTQAGLAAQAEVKRQILDGNFAPLSDRTIEARARRRRADGSPSQAETSKAARREMANRAAGAPPSADAKPLYDTHSLFNAITFVVRDKRSD